MRVAGTWFAFVWTIGVAGFLLFGPVYRSVSSGVQLGHNALTAETTSRSTGLAAKEGLWAFVLVSFPVLIAATPLVAAHRGRSRGVTAGAAGLLGAFALLGAASIGLFYAPAVLALVAVAAVPGR
ncbi:MAG: hypothetical protein IID05_11835 [Gemmatimonadetes bacterium]|nr:hypothetical protein [Gemmatimonadota bacterium]